MVVRAPASICPGPRRYRNPRWSAKPSGEADRSEEHTSELQSPCNLVCRLLLEKKNTTCLSRRLACSCYTPLRPVLSVIMRPSARLDVSVTDAYPLACCALRAQASPVRQRPTTA